MIFSTLKRFSFIGFLVLFFTLFSFYFYTNVKGQATCDWKTTWCGPSHSIPNNVDLIGRIVEVLAPGTDGNCGQKGYVYGIDKDGSGGYKLKCSNDNLARILHVEGRISTDNDIKAGAHIVSDGFIHSNQHISADGFIHSNQYISAVGSIRSSGFFYNSDRTLKENISSLVDPQGVIQRLRGISFTWKKDTEKNPTYGFIAQEVEEVLPSIVVTGEDGKKSVDYGAITPFLVEAVKLQAEEIEMQKAMLQEQEERIRALERVVFE